MLEAILIRILRGVFSSGTVIASGSQVRIEGYDYTSGEWRGVAVTASGEMAIHVTVADIVTAKISGETVVVASGARVLVSGQMVQVASGPHVMVSGQMVAQASGAHVMVSGQMVQVASGAHVMVSGQMVQVASGARVLISGQMVQVASGAYVLISGQGVILAAAQAVKISGEMVSIEVPTEIKTGAILGVTAASAGTIITSGPVKSMVLKSLSGDVYVGGSVAGQMPYIGFGFPLAQGEAVSLDVDNFGRARACAVTSGDLVGFIGVY